MPPRRAHDPAATAREWTFEASDGERLFVRDRRPPGPPIAALLVLHGVGEHGGRYEGLADRLTAAGVAVRLPDLRGHGRSSGPRAHVDRWRRYLDDASGLLADLADELPGVPPLVLGHSMGSLVALELAMGADPGGAAATPPGRVAGWAVSAAGIRPSGVATPLKVALARVLSRILPRVRLSLGIRGEDLSRDPVVVRAYGDDPLVLRRATVRWGAEALSAIERVVAGAARIRGPLLLLHGGADPLADPAGSRWLAEMVGGPAELHVYPGVRHEPHHDGDERSDPMGDLIGWIGARTARASRV